jgi:FimV C-terminal domain
VDEEIDISTPPPETADTEAVDTKLDLARAFLEMGDAEGAKGILEEIRQEGNETQREEAEKLLADIS